MLKEFPASIGNCYYIFCDYLLEQEAPSASSVNPDMQLHVNEP